MRKLLVFIPVLLCAATVLGTDQPKNIPSMPAAVSGNAVASLKGGLEIYSLMGVGPRKTWDDITNQVYVMNLAHAKWPPGRCRRRCQGRRNPHGRLCGGWSRS
jgi:hypothetical protein